LEDGLKKFSVPDRAASFNEVIVSQVLIRASVLFRSLVSKGSGKAQDKRNKYHYRQKTGLSKKGKWNIILTTDFLSY
jgi:hypothetical protein